MPQVPVSVWEQIPIIIVFALLMAGLGWVFMTLFSKQIDKTHEYYAARMKENNEQWQGYFDARASSFIKMGEDMQAGLERLTEVLEELRLLINARPSGRKKIDH